MANRLAALTSLRFLAAAAIVYHHVMGAWAFPRVPQFHFAQGVSFFFVLSGFILTYRYPVLRDWREIRRFWLARFARIWPAHATSLVIVVATATAILSSFDGTNLPFYVANQPTNGAVLDPIEGSRIAERPKLVDIHRIRLLPDVPFTDF
jgi:peptidoglycan/LPS O-acetylase OafA/YrhL